MDLGLKLQDNCPLKTMSRWIRMNPMIKDRGRSRDKGE